MWTQPGPLAFPGSLACEPQALLALLPGTEVVWIFPLDPAPPPPVSRELYPHFYPWPLVAEKLKGLSSSEQCFGHNLWPHLPEPVPPAREAMSCQPGTAWIPWQRKGLCHDPRLPPAAEHSCLPCPKPWQVPSPAPFTRTVWPVTFSLVWHQAALSCKALVFLWQGEGRVPSWLQQGQGWPGGTCWGWMCLAQPRAQLQPCGCRASWQRFIPLPRLRILISKCREAAQQTQQPCLNHLHH